MLMNLNSKFSSNHKNKAIDPEDSLPCKSFNVESEDNSWSYHQCAVLKE